MTQAFDFNKVLNVSMADSIKVSMRWTMYSTPSLQDDCTSEMIQRYNFWHDSSKNWFVVLILLHEATLVVQTHLQLNYVRFNIVATSIMIIIILLQVLYLHYDCFSSLYSKVWTDWLQSVLSSSVQFPRDITNMLLIWLSQSMLKVTALCISSIHINF